VAPQPSLAAALRLPPVVLLSAAEDMKRAAEGQRFAWDKLERTAAMSYRGAETASQSRFRSAGLSDTGREAHQNSYLSVLQLYVST